MTPPKIPAFLRNDLVAYACMLMTLLGVMAIGMALAGCASTDRASVPPDMRQEFDDLELAEKVASETPDPSDDAAVEAAWADLESRIAKRQASPFAALLPYGLGGLALELVGALGSKRKRKLYGSAIKNISSGQVAAAAGDALKAWGVQHSSPQPQPPQQ